MKKVIENLSGSPSTALVGLARAPNNIRIYVRTRLNEEALPV